MCRLTLLILIQSSAREGAGSGSPMPSSRSELAFGDIAGH